MAKAGSGLRIDGWALGFVAADMPCRRSRFWCITLVYQYHVCKD